MKRMFKYFFISIVTLLVIGLVFLFAYVPALSPNYGKVSTTMFLAPSSDAPQPLIVAFGGGGGGNDWARDYVADIRDSLHQRGIAVLAMCYFGCSDTPEYLDRISLDAIAARILEEASRPEIDASKIVLMGGSRGGELVLNLASRFDHFHSVIAMSTSHVSFPAITLSSNTSSWMHGDEEVPYLPATFAVIGPALKRDLYAAHSVMLADTVAVRRAEIPVENINGPILVVSGKLDDQWPATMMSERLMERLAEHDFEHAAKHVVLDGGHTALLYDFGIVYDFLEEHL